MDSRNDAAASPAPTPRPSRGLLMLVSAFVLVVAVAGYARYGQPGAWRGAPTDAAQADPQAQIAAMVGTLEERLKAQPDDATGWSMLGRSYSVLGRYAESVEAFKRVIALQPNDAQAHADQADALAMASGRQLAGEPARLIARALELDPKNLKALALAGTIAFERADYATAVRHWEGAIAAAEPGSELARNLRGGVDEARSRGSLAPAAGASAAAPAAAPIAGPASAVAPGDARVSGSVTLAPALLANAVPGDTVFVFARAVDGRRAPLAILRKQVKDLPFDFTLDDSLAMSPAMRLSSAQQVVIGARISKSGNAVAQAGDLQGLSAPVPVGARGVKVEIGEVLK
jgi:cytochrome c-type biogenesis protein CcmH